MKQKFICPICKGEAFHFLFLAKDRMFELSGEFSVERCSSCLTISIFPMLTMSELKKFYPPQKYYAYDVSSGKSFFFLLRSYLIRQHDRPNLIATLLHVVVPRVPAIPYKKPGGKILDVGCGTGETLVLLKQLDWETYGIDIDPKAVDIAKKRGVDHVRVGFYQDIADYPDNFFDVVRLYHVIEHLDDPMRCVRLIREKLKKGGQLIIGTPNANSFVAKIFGTYWYNLDIPRHLVLFSPRTLTRAVKNSGFQIKGTEFCSAGGFIGSVQYVFQEKFHVSWDLIHKQWLVILFYPFEWLLDKFGKGDVFVLRAIK